MFRVYQAVDAASSQIASKTCVLVVIKTRRKVSNSAALIDILQFYQGQKINCVRVKFPLSGEQNIQNTNRDPSSRKTFT